MMCDLKRSIQVIRICMSDFTPKLGKGAVRIGEEDMEVEEDADN
jgi:hypothetical protein